MDNELAHRAVKPAPFVCSSWRLANYFALVVAITGVSLGINASTGRGSVLTQTASASTFGTLAGQLAPGFADGEGGPDGTASFNGPMGLSYDTAGNLYIADTENHAIRKIDTNQKVTTIAGNGTAGFVDGAGGRDGVARFNKPFDVTTDNRGNLFVADSGNGAIRKIDAIGNVTTFAKMGAYGRIEFDSKENLLVNSVNSINKIDIFGNTSTMQSGFPGILKDYFGYELAIDPFDNLYVLKGYPDLNTVTKFNSEGKIQASWDFRGLPTKSPFSLIYPRIDLRSLTIDREGNVYVAEAHGLSKITPDGKVFTGTGYSSDFPGIIELSPQGGLTAISRHAVFHFGNVTFTKPRSTVIYNPNETTPTTVQPRSYPDFCKVNRELQNAYSNSDDLLHASDYFLALRNFLNSFQTRVPRELRSDWASLSRNLRDLSVAYQKYFKRRSDAWESQQLWYGFNRANSELIRSKTESKAISRITQWFFDKCETNFYIYIR
jgi:hypothetical protein